MIPPENSDRNGKILSSLEDPLSEFPALVIGPGKLISLADFSRVSKVPKTTAQSWLGNASPNVCNFFRMVHAFNFFYPGLGDAYLNEVRCRAIGEND